MTPSAEPTPTAARDAIAPAGVLEDGEIILLAIKPSLWFVLLVSWPVLLAAGVVAAGVQLFSGVLGSLPWRDALLSACAVIAAIRLALAALQWIGRLYLLTNRRMISVRGVLRPDIEGCPLRKVREVTLAAVLPERALGLASLLFEVSGAEAEVMIWLHINRPADVLRMVQEALSQAR